MIKQRDISIDIVKFFAVFLIINSHADIMYARYASLATGGAIGDALFLFCSATRCFGVAPNVLTIGINGVSAASIRLLLPV